MEKQTLELLEKISIHYKHTISNKTEPKQ